MRKTPPKIRPLTQSGISLVEIVISLMIVVFVILIITSVPQSIRLVGSSNKESLAKDIVNKKIEDLRNQGYASLANGTTQILDSRLDNLPSASASVVISDCPVTVCTNGEKTKQAEVKVSWDDNGKIKNVTVNTLISEGGLK